MSNTSTRDGFPCIYVKTHGIHFAHSVADSEEVRAKAWEALEYEFWSNASAKAHTLGFSGAMALGRSGGWLAPYFQTHIFGTENYHTRGADLSDARERRKFEALARYVDKAMRKLASDYARHLVNARREHGPQVSILSIDAWRDNGGWTWNSWYKIGECGAAWADATPREILAMFRERGFTRADSKGRACIEDDQRNIVICARGTREPVYAIAYGESQS